MDILITYDIKTSNASDPKNKVVKDAMKKAGYWDHYAVRGTNRIVYLPNTSLWKKDTTSHAAKEELLRIAKEHNATIERLFATQFVNYASIDGEKF